MISTKITTFLLPGLVSRTRWKKQIPKTTRDALLTIIVALVIVLAGSEVLFADDVTGSTEVIQSLMQSPKLRGPERILQDFVDGESTTRVIVSLQKPAAANGLQDMKDLSVREQLAQEVSSACSNALNRLDMDEISITNRYNYLFGFSAEVSLEGLKGLVDDPDIASINKDEIDEINLAQGIPLMNAATVRGTYDGSGLSIAICDTGIDYTHPRLGDSDDFNDFPNAKVIGGYDCGQDDNDPMDGHGHGTCCAGIAAGDLGTVEDYIGGVAPGARLYALKITYTSTNSKAYRSDELEAWDWCVAHQNDDPSNPIMIISMSFGGGYHASSCDGEEPLMTTAASNARAAGITLFVSSGNDGYCGATGFPACITHVISVGAVYDADLGIRYPCVSSGSCAPKTYTEEGCLPFSQWYATDDTEPDMVTSYSNTANFLDILAPSNAAYTTDIVGAGGYSAGNYYPSFSGTSAACPYTAGAAACLQAAADDVTGTYLTPDELQFLLTYTGDLITDPKVAITKPRVNLGKAAFCASCNVWVDFSHSGTENGSYDYPYNTLAEAVMAAGSGETICIKPGSSDETITITKAVTLGTCTGPVIIGL